MRPEAGAGVEEEEGGYWFEKEENKDQADAWCSKWTVCSAKSSWPCQCVLHQMKISCSVEQGAALFIGLLKDDALERRSWKSQSTWNVKQRRWRASITVFNKREKKKAKVQGRKAEKSKGSSPRLPPGIIGVVHHVGVVPTLALAPKQALAGPGIALRLVLHPRLQDARVHKID